MKVSHAEGGSQNNAAGSSTAQKFRLCSLVGLLDQSYAFQESVGFGAEAPKTAGHLIGGIDFDVFVRSTHQIANFGYVIYSRHWGRG